MIAVFARPNHPQYKTQVMGGEIDSAEWRYHGYVVVFVRFAGLDQLEALRQKLANDGLPEPFGHASYEQGWYGGRLDLLTVLDGDIYADSDWYFSPVRHGNERASIGDNRYAGVYDAEELL